MAAPLHTQQVGAPLGAADLIIVLLHGRGVPGDDLVRVCQGIVLELEKLGLRIAALLPEGPLCDGLGRGWWKMPVDMDVNDASQWKPPADIIDRFVVTVKDALAQCEKQPALIFGGFSSGAVLATHGLAHMGSQGTSAIGLAVLSGFLDTAALSEACKFMPLTAGCLLQVFLSHGSGDQVIPETVVHNSIAAAQEVSENSLRKISMEKHFHKGGHELGVGTEAAMVAWLSNVIGDLKKSPGETDHPQAVVITSDMLSNCGGDEDGPYEAGDMVRLHGVSGAPHLEGTRAVLVSWDGIARKWQVEVVATNEYTNVPPASLQRYISEQERRCRRTTADALMPLTEHQREELRSFQIDEIYDHPQLLDLIWGTAKDVHIPEGCEQAQIGGVPCLVFGRRAASGGVAPTVLLFKGNTSFQSATFESLAAAYMEAVGAQVVVPFCPKKLSECLAAARAVAAALPKAFGPGPLLVHGANTGSIMAIQVAAELGNPASMPRVQLLVLDNGVPSLNWIPNAQGLIGCLAVDPFAQEAKLRLVRCPIMLVRGFKGELPPNAGNIEPIDILGNACSIASKVRVPSSLAEDGSLIPEVRDAITDALNGLKASSSRWVVDSASCLVREGAGLKSKEVGRLLGGALLEQLDQQGTRLLVRKLEGDGPNEGWISFAVNGRTVLRPFE